MFFVPLGLLHPDTMALIDPLEQSYMGRHLQD